MEQGLSVPRDGRRRAPTHTARVAPLLLLFAANLGAETSVYQCTTPDGAVEFRQRPCDEGSNGQRLDIEDRKTGWVPSEARIDDKPSAAEKPSNRKRKSASAEGSARARREEQCWKKRQLLEEVNWKLKRGYKASQGNKLRRKRRVYEDYISQLCK